MDFYKKLPTAAQIGIPVLGLLVVLFVVYTTMMKQPAPVIVVQTQDNGVYEAAQQVLKNANIEYELDADSTKTTYTVKVAEADKTEASNKLATSGIRDLSGTIEKITCPAPPGFTATKAANERADNCEDSKAVQSMLLTAGASAANVKVSQRDNDTLIGPETSKSVLGQVFLPPEMVGKWPADQAAQAIATAIGTSIDNVTLTDGKLQVLFTGGKGQSATTGAAVATGTVGCDEMATATEIATKEAAVSNCYNSRIGAELTKLLGGSDRFQLTVNARVDAKSRSSEYTRNASGAVKSQTTDKGDGRSMNDVDNEPSTMSGGEVKPAGDISMLSLAVTLDSNFVDDRQELAVKRMLSAYVVASRKDPAPKVTRIPFGKGAGGAKADMSDELTALQSTARSGAVQPETIVKTDTKLPRGLIAMMGVVVAFLVVGMAILWRRSANSAQERARYEAEFANQQRVLDTYAQQDPAAIAADLERMFGAPSAQRAAY